MTKLPKVSTTLPAYPSVRTSRVVLTLSASRNSVSTRMTAGNDAKSSGLVTNIATSRISSATG